MARTRGGGGERCVRAGVCVPRRCGFRGRVCVLTGGCSCGAQRLLRSPRQQQCRHARHSTIWGARRASAPLCHCPGRARGAAGPQPPHPAPGARAREPCSRGLSPLLDALPLQRCTPPPLLGVAGADQCYARRFKMGDGTLAFWKFAHKSEPIVVYSVILGVLGSGPPPRLAPTSRPAGAPLLVDTGAPGDPGHPLPPRKAGSGDPGAPL